MGQKTLQTEGGTNKAIQGFKISSSNVSRNRKHLPGVLSTAALSLMFQRESPKLDLQIWKTHPASCRIVKLGSFVRLGSRLTLDSSPGLPVLIVSGNRAAVLPVLPVWASCQWPDRGEKLPQSRIQLPPPHLPV